MKLLVKIYEHQRINTVITQELIDSKIEIDESLSDFWVAKFTVPMIDIQEDNKIEIYEIWNTDKKIFSWYVYKIQPIWKQFWILNVECRSEKALMNKRLFLQDKTFTWVSVSSFLDSIILDYSAPYNEQRTYELDFSSNVTMTVKQWDNYFDVLDEIATQNNANRDIRDWKIYIKQLIWKDYTSWTLYKEINYNWLYPNNSNIKNINVVWTATRNNIIIAEDTNHTKILNTTWYTDRIYWVWKSEYRVWDLTTNSQKLLANNNQNQRTYEIEVEQNALDVNIWDKIKLIVENTNSYFDINSDVIINKKNTLYNNWSKIVKYDIGTINIYPVNIENWLYWIQKSVKLLKLG